MNGSLVCIEINSDKQDLPEGFPLLLSSDTHDMILNDGHLLEKWYHPWYCGPQLHHVGAPYEQCTDRSNGISVFPERDVDGTARLFVLTEIPSEL